jgi:tripartite-type tricarboxylate transporter receptor subunit TctC
MGALAEQGRLKVIGQLGAQRSELLKNVPTVSEGQALKNFSYKIWTGFMVPKSTPEDVVVRCTPPSARRCRTRPCARSWRRRRRWPAAPMTLAESAKFFEAETARYRAIAKQINLQPQ